MRNTIVLFSIIAFTISSSSLFAQIHGNGRMITKTFDLKKFEEVSIEMHANIIIDLDAPRGMTISAESNLIDYIDRSVNSGTLQIDQVEWIEPSKSIEIKIGAPGLKYLKQDAHDNTKVINLNTDYFKVKAPIGHFELEGNVERLVIKTKQAYIDASKLIATKAEVESKSYAELILNVVDYLDCDFDEGTKVEFTREPNSSSGCNKINDRKHETYYTNARYINLKIKNNSLNRHHFEVVGPKQDGRSFGYGFPMWPQQKKDKYWTIGTKVYKKNALGGRKLVCTITAEDEGKTVDLFQ